MTVVRRPSPLGELLSLRRAMDRFIDDDFFRPMPWTTETGGFALDVSTGPEAFLVEAALPGVRPEEVDITVENGTLTIRGETRSERQEGEGEYLVREIRRGSFARAITLPTGLEPDKASATFENGVLRLRIPKTEEVKPRQIRISPTIEAGADAGASTAEVPSS
ncbi:MAG TPA: Hsp20/alpha crystallin family protein [Candidatus Limnocylindrales bacterium]|jgi:HSP20 family protein